MTKNITPALARVILDVPWHRGVSLREAAGILLVSVNAVYMHLLRAERLGLMENSRDVRGWRVTALGRQLAAATHKIHAQLVRAQNV